VRERTQGSAILQAVYEAAWREPSMLAAN